MLIKEPTTSYGIYLGSTSSVTSDPPLTDSGISGSSHKQFLEDEDSQIQLSSSFQTMLPISSSYQYGMYYVQRSIEDVVQTSPQANCLAIL